MADLESRPSAHSSLRHELRTPLNQIIGYAQLLQEEATDTGQDGLLADLRKIEAAGRRLCEIIDSVVLIPSIPPISVIEVTHSLTPVPSPPASSISGYILVVDDNPMNRDMLSRRLVQRGFEVAEVEGGREAIEAVKTRVPDIILLDVMMPEISGLDVLSALRQSYSIAALPIIMVTAKDSADDIVRALSLGANDYVSKPVDFRVAMARIETHLALKRSRDESVFLHSQLIEAQEQISRLSDTASIAVDELNAWASAAARDVCSLMRAQAVSVWILTGNSLQSICGYCSISPDISTLRASSRPPRIQETNDAVIVPVVGMTGELFGALVVEGAPNAARSGARVLWTFARQLGAALELRQIKAELSRVQSQRPAAQEQERIEAVQVCTVCGACFAPAIAICPHDRAALQASGTLPYRIGDRYRLLALIGEGGMSRVFLAFDERLERETAIKVLRPELLYNSTARMRFEQEAKVIARIDHAGVVAIHDSGELSDGSVYLVMERLLGCDVGRLVGRFGAGTPVQVASLVRQAAAALHAAHEFELVHRDIKPENLFLTPQGDGLRVKLLDFGLAREMTVESHLTQTGVLVGTPLYMSPEQILGKPFDQRTDIFSFAAVVYLALTGHPTSTQADFGGIMLDIVYGQPPSVAQVLPESALVLDPLFSQALARSADDRPRNILGWSEQIAEVMEKIPSERPGWPDNNTILALGQERSFPSPNLSGS